MVMWNNCNAAVTCTLRNRPSQCSVKHKLFVFQHHTRGDYEGKNIYIPAGKWYILNVWGIP